MSTWALQIQATNGCQSSLTYCGLMMKYADIDVGSALLQLMACWILGNIFSGNESKYNNFHIENAFENVICEMAAV